MSKFTDQQYLKTDQYRDSTNLDARAEIHRRFSTNPYGWLNWVFDTLMKLPADAKILELGCGPAYLWKECDERIPAGWNITLSDLSPGMLDAAWRNLVVIGRAFKFKEIDAQTIPFIAYIRSSIHATELSEEKLANIQFDLEKELKEKGKIFISKDSGLFEAVK